MRTVCVMNEKGGVGKTTLASHLAWFFADAGLRTLAVDLDQQCNLTHLLRDHACGVTALDLFGAPVEIVPSPLTFVPADGRINERVDRGAEDAILTFSQNIKNAAADFDVCVIDTPPALRTIRTIAAAYVADYAVAPMDLADFSIMGIENLLRFIHEIPEALNREPIEFLGLLPSKFHRSSPDERAKLEQLAQTFGKAMFPSAIPKRDAYAKSVSECQPVWRCGPGARDAGKEMRAVLAEIAERMGIEIRENGR